MKLLMMVTTLLLSSLAMEAQEETNDRITALFIISSNSRDFVGQGREKAYYPEDGTFTISQIWYDGAIGINFHSTKKGEWWSLRFGGANEEEPRIGLFTNAKRHPFSDASPGFDVDSDHRGCNRLSGQFEILELEYNDAGVVTAFAANFVQKCEETGPPLFGSIRINSCIPIETRFREHLQKKLEPSVIFVSKLDPLTGERTSTLLSAEPNKLEISRLPLGGEGIEIIVESQDESWIFDFAAPIGSEFTKGKYETSCRYPFNSYFEAGIAVTLSDSASAHPSGSFEIIDIQRSITGEIHKLILQFTIKTETGEIYEGIIRHLSNNSSTFQTDEIDLDDDDDDDF
jgi:hypothetical protein